MSEGQAVMALLITGRPYVAEMSLSFEWFSSWCDVHADINTDVPTCLLAFPAVKLSPKIYYHYFSRG